MLLLTLAPVCPYDGCGNVFTSLDVYTEHVALHTQQNITATQRRREEWYREGYSGQYRRTLETALSQHRITEKMLRRFLEEMERNVYKADSATRTKGFFSSLLPPRSLLISQTWIP